MFLTFIQQESVATEMDYKWQRRVVRRLLNSIHRIEFCCVHTRAKDGSPALNDIKMLAKCLDWRCTVFPYHFSVPLKETVKADTVCGDFRSFQQKKILGKKYYLPNFIY